MTRSAPKYGYTGGAQRIVATVDGLRRPIAWGDEITADELASFMACEEFVDVEIEWVADPAEESRRWPPSHGFN